MLRAFPHPLLPACPTPALTLTLTLTLTLILTLTLTLLLQAAKRGAAHHTSVQIKEVAAAPGMPVRPSLDLHSMVVGGCVGGWVYVRMWVGVGVRVGVGVSVGGWMGGWVWIGGCTKPPRRLSAEPKCPGMLCRRALLLQYATEQSVLCAAVTGTSAAPPREALTLCASGPS